MDVILLHLSGKERGMADFKFWLKEDALVTHYDSKGEVICYDRKMYKDVPYPGYRLSCHTPDVVILRPSIFPWGKSVKIVNKWRKIHVDSLVVKDLDGSFVLVSPAMILKKVAD
jgi:hypothetical protein